MTDPRYKAFISYSHRDESWASWLHQSLESYALPKKLVGTVTQHGEVPHKLFPVFRDRDELASANDLSERIRSALEESESLVVICSPSAAASRWVNEEIRAFRALGRSDRIFPVIVDGDPQATRLEDSCFPPALLEDELGESVEPLAADARKWADGKTLARLKLVAGILGVRLDVLRQREQARQRKRKAIFAGLAVAVAIMAGVTFMARWQESSRREHAEDLVSQIVQISEQLNSVVDSQTLRTIAEPLQGYLETLDRAALTPGAKKQIALVLRQLGEVNRVQGEESQAMEALIESRALINELVEQDPGNNDFLYELGNAEFYVANLMMAQGNYADGGAGFERYLETASELSRREPDNPDWLIERSYAHTNLAGYQNISGSGDLETTRGHIAAAIVLSEQALELSPGNAGYLASYTNLLAWDADTSLRSCDLNAALESRSKSEMLARRQAERGPGDYNLRKQHAYRLTGVASLQTHLGNLDEAQKHLVEARQIMDELSKLDPENLEYQWDTLMLESRMTMLRGEASNSVQALISAGEISARIGQLLRSKDLAQTTWKSQYAQHLIDYSDLLWRNQVEDKARASLEEATVLLGDLLETSDSDRQSRVRLARARFHWWEQTGQDLVNDFPVMAELFTEPMTRDEKSCINADTRARVSLMEGDPEDAKARVDYLVGTGYKNPEFMRFCVAYNLCEQAIE